VRILRIYTDTDLIRAYRVCACRSRPRLRHRWSVRQRTVCHRLSAMVVQPPCCPSPAPTPYPASVLVGRYSAAFRLWFQLSALSVRGGLVVMPLVPFCGMSTGGSRLSGLFSSVVRAVVYLAVACAAEVCLTNAVAANLRCRIPCSSACV
jgi:hypothetical protein